MRTQVRRLPEEDCEEDGDLAALQVHLHLLWQGQDEETGHWHLVLQRQELQDPGGWRCLHLHHHCCSLHQVPNPFHYQIILEFSATALCVLPKCGIIQFFMLQYYLVLYSPDSLSCISGSLWIKHLLQDTIYYSLFRLSGLFFPFQVCREEAEGDEGGLNAALVILITSPQLARICQNCGADSVPQYFLFHNVPRKITPVAVSGAQVQRW